MQKTLTYGLARGVPQAISDPEINQSEESWDSIKQTFLYQPPAGHTIQSGLAQDFPAWGAHPLYGQMYLLPPSAKSIGGTFYEVATEYQGVFRDRGFRRKIKVFGESASGESVFLGNNVQDQGYPSYVAKFKLEQIAISVETSYNRGSQPQYADVKQPVDLLTLPAGYPPLPAPPVSFWSSLADPTYVYPSGWIYDDIQVDQLGSAPLYDITDRHVFRHRLEI